LCCQVAASLLPLSLEFVSGMGTDLTTLYILRKLKELFDELAFSQEIYKGSTTVGRNLKVARLKLGGDFQSDSRMVLV